MHSLLNSIDKKVRFREGGRELIAQTLRGEPIGQLPLIFWKTKHNGVSGNDYNLKEQFYDKEKMLHGQLEEIDAVCANTFDAQLCVRPNFGTIFVPAMFGLEYKVFNDKYPWIATHLDKKHIKNFRMPRLDELELMEKAIEYITFCKAILPEYIHIYQPDTQGPFDIAHLVYGDGLFMELYDDPRFVHDLMAICVEMYIEVTKFLKAAIGEKQMSCYHGHALARGIFLDSGGVRISEDSATLISPGQIDEFVVPYVKQALHEFGGGFIHYCGSNAALLDAFLLMDEVRAINFGNPEMHDFDETMRKFIHHGKCYFGLWPKQPGETAGEYVARMKGASKGGTRGLLLHFDEDMFPGYSCEQILAIWEESPVAHHAGTSRL